MSCVWSRLLIFSFIFLIGSSCFGLPITIDESEIGLLLQNGAYIKNLTPGVYEIDPEVHVVFVLDNASAREMVFSCSDNSGTDEDCITVLTANHAYLNIGISVTFKIRDDEITPFDLYIMDPQNRNYLSEYNDAAITEWERQRERGNVYSYTFQINEPENALRKLCRSAVSTVLGSRDFQEVLWNDTTQIEDEIRNILQWKSDSIFTGLYIENVTISEILLPFEIQAEYAGSLKRNSRASTLVDRSNSGEGFLQRREGRKATNATEAKDESFEIGERYQSIITHRGIPIKTITEAGQHRKKRDEEVVYLPASIRLVSVEKEQYITRDKYFISLSSVLAWRIRDPELFYIHFPDVAGASHFLNDLVNGGVRNSVAIATLPFARYLVDPDVDNAPQISALEDDVLRNILADWPIGDYGISLFDVSVFVETDPVMADSIYHRMRSQIDTEIMYRLSKAESFKYMLMGMLNQKIERVMDALQLEDMDVQEAVHLIEFYFEDVYSEISLVLEEVEEECFDILGEDLISEILQGFRDAVSPIVDKFAHESRVRIDAILEERITNINRVLGGGENR